MDTEKAPSVTIDLVPVIDPTDQTNRVLYTTWDQAFVFYFGEKLVSFLAGVPWKFVLGGAGLLVLFGLVGLPRPPRRRSKHR